MTVTITQDIVDIGGLDDNTPIVFFQAGHPRVAEDGSTMVSTRRLQARPVSGTLTVELEPGPAVAQIGGRMYPFTVPDVDSTLWPLIQVGMAPAPTPGVSYVVNLGALGEAAGMHPGGAVSWAVVTESWAAANPDPASTLLIVVPDPD